MHLGFYVSRIDREQGHERNVPAHIQIPLRTMELLAERGHDVHLITTDPTPGNVLPHCMPRNIHVHHVVDSRRRSRASDERKYPSSPADSYLLKSLKQLNHIRRIAREQNLQVLHFHGYEWAIYAAGLLRWMRMSCPVVVTHYGPPDPPGFIARLVGRRIDAATAATQYVADHWYSLGPKPYVIGHGLVRDLLSEFDGQVDREKSRVLFWRDPSHRNGADICLAVFDRLAPVYPHISFDLALRPNPNEVPGVDELAARHENVHVYRFPYSTEVSLARLMAESICTLLPFRSLTANPQLAIAETLAAGVPVVTTTVEANPEWIEHEQMGLLIPPGDVDAAVEAVKRLLDQPDEAARMGRHAGERTKELWNWDRSIDQLLELYEAFSAKR